MVSGSAAKLLLALLGGTSPEASNAVLMAASGIKDVGTLRVAKAELTHQGWWKNPLDAVRIIPPSPGNIPLNNSTPGEKPQGEENFSQFSGKEPETETGEDTPTAGLQPVTAEVRRSWDEAERKLARVEELRKQGKRGGTW